MATNYKFPGVYPNVIDRSQIVSTNATTACAFVGEAEFGPVFKPTLVTSAQDYTQKFGRLSSKYGYAGYSLAVASETINENYFVRVVPTGIAGKHLDSDAKWASTSIRVKGSDAERIEGGYYYDEIDGAATLRDVGSPTGLFPLQDWDNAIIVAAIDPNYRKFFVSIADSTINPYRAYSLQSQDIEIIPIEESGEESGSSQSLVTVKVAESAALEIKPNDPIVVKNFSEPELNGIFKAYSVEIDENTGYTLISYYVEGNHKKGSLTGRERIGRYPDDNETTFSVTVYENDHNTVLEFFEFCTLYPAVDNYGNSMYIEDVINNTSNYIQVFVNDKLYDDADPDVVAIPETTGLIELIGGSSGTWEDTTDEEGKLTRAIDNKYRDLCDAWDLYMDRSQITVSLLMNSGYITDRTTSYQDKMIQIAEHRRDCFCLLDVPMTQTDFEDLKDDFRPTMQASNSYRAALFSPWVKTFDSVQGRANFVMCPSAYIAKIMGASDPWVAPAGLNRGVLSSNIVSPTGLTEYYDVTTGGILYTDNQINCIIREKGTGYINWGQRTLQKKPSALDRINVARTIIYIETVLRDAARFHLFENNTAYERLQVEMQFGTFLQQILAADGIQQYKVVCDESNNPPSVINNNQMVIDIYIIPSYTAEVIHLNTYVMATGATVSITTSSQK